MNITKRYDVVAVIGSFERDGEVKRVYRTVGTLAETDTGPVLWLDRCFSPAGLPRKNDEGSVLLSCYPQDREATNTSRKMRGASPDDDNEPF